MDERRKLVAKRVLIVDADEDGNVTGEYLCPSCGQKVARAQLIDGHYVPCRGYFVRVVMRARYVINEQVL